MAEQAKREVPGFFILSHEGAPVLSSEPIPGLGFKLPRQFRSLSAAENFAEEANNRSLRFAVTSRVSGGHIVSDGPASDEGQPITWAAHTETGLWEIAYIGSHAYHSGRVVEPGLVGTEEEMFE